MEINDKKIKIEQNFTQTRLSMFDIHRKRYEKFQEDMKKSDLGQGYTRYLQEFYILETLGEYAMEEGNSENMNFVRENAQRVTKKLQDSFGITIKSEILDKLQ